MGVVVFGQELLQVASLVTCLETEETRIQKLWRIQQRLGMGWWSIQQRIYRGFLYYWWWRRVFLVIWNQDSFWIWRNEEEINTKIVCQHCVKFVTCNEIVRKL